ncbi:MAG: hypothetical protein AABY22_32175, partial [Nanoarchaeota archaeon]
IRPSKYNDERISLVNDLKISFSEYIQTNLTTTTIIPNPGSVDPGKTCFSIDNLPETIGLKTVVKSEDRQNIPAIISGNKLIIGAVGDLFYINYNQHLEEESFTIPAQGCDDLALGEYKVGLIKNLKFISLSKTLKTKEDMENLANYNSLKAQLGIPNNNDFTFFLRNTNNEKIVNAENLKDIGSNVEIYTEEFPISYIDEKANIKQGWINIQVW